MVATQRLICVSSFHSIRIRNLRVKLFTQHPPRSCSLPIPQADKTRYRSSHTRRHHSLVSPPAVGESPRSLWLSSILSARLAVFVRPPDVSPCPASPRPQYARAFPALLPDRLTLCLARTLSVSAERGTRKAPLPKHGGRSFSRVGQGGRARPEWRRRGTAWTHGCWAVFGQRVAGQAVIRVVLRRRWGGCGLAELDKQGGRPLWPPPYAERGQGALPAS